MQSIKSFTLDSRSASWLDKAIRFYGRVDGCLEVTYGGRSSGGVPVRDVLDRLRRLRHLRQIWGANLELDVETFYFILGPFSDKLMNFKLDIRDAQGEVKWTNW